MVSAILHFLVTIVGVIGSLAVYSSWKKQQFKSDMAKQMFLGMVFFIIYQALLSFPFLLLGNNVLALAYGYIGAIVFLFLTLAVIVMMGMEMLDVSNQKRNAAVIFMLVVGLLVTVVQLIQLPVPYFEASFIFWNADFMSAMLTSISVFLVTAIFVVIMIKGWSSHFDLTQKARAIILNFGFLALALSGLIYYPSHNLSQTAISFDLGILGAMWVVIALLIKKYKPSAKK